MSRRRRIKKEEVRVNQTDPIISMVERHAVKEMKMIGRPVKNHFQRSLEETNREQEVNEIQKMMVSNRVKEVAPEKLVTKLPEIDELRQLIFEKLLEKTNCDLALKKLRKVYEVTMINHCDRHHDFQKNYVYDRKDKTPIRVLLTNNDCKECENIKSTYETIHIEFEIKCIEASVDALIEDITALSLGFEYKAYHKMSPIAYFKERLADYDDRRHAMSLERIRTVEFNED